MQTSKSRSNINISSQNSSPLEKNPDAPLRLLSLDGGGVRGLSSILVLEDLMECIAREEKRLGRRALNDNTIPRPCDYFDLIGGTSTGGIIAVLLGRLRLTCRQCLDIYMELAREIFKKDRSLHISGVKIPFSANRFSGAVLEREIKKALVKLGFREDELMWDDSLFYEDTSGNVEYNSIWRDIHSSSQTAPPMNYSPSTSPSSDSTRSSDVESSKITSPEKSVQNKSFSPSGDSSNINGINNFIANRFKKVTNPIKRCVDRRHTWRVAGSGSVCKRKNQSGCRTFVVTALKNALGLPRILATYDPSCRHVTIWQALRATSAAPTFFEPITFGSPKMTYLDGGMGWNNPCAEVAYAAKSIWEGRSIGCIVSIGTGLHTLPSVKKFASWLPFGLGTDIALASALASMATSTSRVHNELQRTYFDTPTSYFRFDVDGGLANVSLEQWMREDEITSLTEEYMNHPQQRRNACQLGKILVKLSVLPPVFQISATQFSVGLRNRDVLHGHFKYERLDFSSSQFTLPPQISHQRRFSASSEGGITVDSHFGISHVVYPVGDDMRQTSNYNFHTNPDVDDIEDTQIILPPIFRGLHRTYNPPSPIASIQGIAKSSCATVLTAISTDKVCLRMLRRNIPPGRYRVKFIVNFSSTWEHNSRVTNLRSLHTSSGANGSTPRIHEEKKLVHRRIDSASSTTSDKSFASCSSSISSTTNTSSTSSTNTSTVSSDNDSDRESQASDVSIRTTEQLDHSHIYRRSKPSHRHRHHGHRHNKSYSSLSTTVTNFSAVTPSNVYSYANNRSVIHPPSELIFSVGRPLNPDTFLKRVVDVRIDPDIVPVLLHPDAVRIRVGRRRLVKLSARGGWHELSGDDFTSAYLPNQFHHHITRPTQRINASTPRQIPLHLRSHSFTASPRVHSNLRTAFVSSAILSENGREFMEDDTFAVRNAVRRPKTLDDVDKTALMTNSLNVTRGDAVPTRLAVRRAHHYHHRAASSPIIETTSPSIYRQPQLENRNSHTYDYGAVRVGLDGCLGFVVSSRFVPGKAIGGWSFGGVRVEPLFD